MKLLLEVINRLINKLINQNPEFISTVEKMTLFIPLINNVVNLCTEFTHVSYNKITPLVFHNR